MIIVKRKPVHFEHDVVYYVPVFQVDFEKDGTLKGYPSFTYDMSEATQDEQMAWSFNPNYVLELRGHFDATTKSLILQEEDDETN